MRVAYYSLETGILPVLGNTHDTHAKRAGSSVSLVTHSMQSMYIDRRLIHSHFASKASENEQRTFVLAHGMNMPSKNSPNMAPAVMPPRLIDT